MVCFTPLYFVDFGGGPTIGIGGGLFTLIVPDGIDHNCASVFYLSGHSWRPMQFIREIS
jgi:hypothetical protein